MIHAIVFIVSRKSLFETWNVSTFRFLECWFVDNGELFVATVDARYGSWDLRVMSLSELQWSFNWNKEFIFEVKRSKFKLEV